MRLMEYVRGVVVAAVLLAVCVRWRQALAAVRLWRGEREWNLYVTDQMAQLASEPPNRVPA